MTDKVRLMFCEFGMGSDTYDFSYQCVIADDEGKIKSIMRGGRFIHWWLSWFYPVAPLVNYGYGYRNMEAMSSDLRAKQIRKELL